MTENKINPLRFKGFQAKTPDAILSGAQNFPDAVLRTRYTYAVCARQCAPCHKKGEEERGKPSENGRHGVRLAWGGHNQQEGLSQNSSYSTPHDLWYFPLDMELRDHADKTFDSLNTHGAFLQHAVQNELWSCSSLCEDTALEVPFSNLGPGRVDILASFKDPKSFQHTVCLAVEVKKVYQKFKAWAFIQSKSRDTRVVRVGRCYGNAPSRSVATPETEGILSFLNIPSVSVGYEIEDPLKGKEPQKNQSDALKANNDSIDLAFRQAAAGAIGMGSELVTTQMLATGRIFSVFGIIVTNAKLFRVDYDESKVSLQEGIGEDMRLIEEPCLFHSYPLPRRNDEHPDFRKLSHETNELSNQRYLEGVIVVYAPAIQSLFNKDKGGNLLENLFGLSRAALSSNS